MKISINDILLFLHEKGIEYQFYGDNNLNIEGFCALSELKPNSVTWIKNISRYNLTEIDPLLKLLIVTNSKPDRGCSDYNLIIAKQPKVIFFEILSKYFKEPVKTVIAKSSVIETSAIGKNVSIGHNCYICKDVSIGDNVMIKHNVIIQSPAAIGNDCVIDSGTVIGCHGFGYYKIDCVPIKVPDFAGVIIGNRVEIGANVNIERGTLTDTVIKDDVKIGGHCLIGHNVHIDVRTIIINRSMLCGSCKIGQDVYIAPGAVIMNRLNVGNNAFVAMGAIVNKNVKENQLVAGNPAEVIKDGLRYINLFKV